MISVLRTHTNLKTPGHEELSLDNLRPGSWINMTAPTRQELEDVSRLVAVPLDFLSAALDIEESSRIDVEEMDEDSGYDACILLLIHANSIAMVMLIWKTI